MRKEILQAVFEPLEPGKFCATKCDVWEKSVVSYLEGLQKTGIWPIHGLHKKCNEDIVDGAGFLNWKCDIPTGACSSCKSRLEGPHIKAIREKIHKYWHGLCLDCMNISAPKTGDLDDDYCKYSRRNPLLFLTTLLLYSSNSPGTSLSSKTANAFLGLHNSIQGWDNNCRISHGRNTWYFSFMGRQEIMNSFQKAQQERNRAARPGRSPFSRSSLFSRSD
jgi:hypothetical protein